MFGARTGAGEVDFCFGSSGSRSLGGGLLVGPRVSGYFFSTFGG